MNYPKLINLPKLLPPRKGRLTSIKRSQEELTAAEHQLVQEQFDIMYQDQDKIIDKLEIKIL